MVSRSRTVRTILATALVGGALLAAPMPAQAKGGGSLDVMTQNLYLGADLFPAIEASEQGTGPFLVAAAKVYQEAMASDFPTRAAALARTIKAEKPDIIGLQEVTEWITTRLDASGPALQSQNFLKILSRAIKAEGLDYTIVGVSRNASIGPFPYIDESKACPAPTSILPSTWPCSIQMKDRDVLLVNAKTKGLSFSKKSVKSGQFKDQQTYTIAGQVISFGRGYVYADMKYKGAKFRMANTHLEVGGASAGFQRKQAKQFVKIMKKSPGTVIATGDFNTDAYGNYSAKSYTILTDYFTDAWQRKRDGKGLTCCQNAALSNPVSENDTRIDFVFTRGKATSKKAVTTNAKPFRATPVPLWEADHAGVLATLRVR